MLYWSPLADVALSLRSALSVLYVHVHVLPNRVHLFGAVPDAPRDIADVHGDGSVSWMDGDVLIYVTPTGAGPDVDTSTLRTLTTAARRLGQVGMQASIRRSVTHADVEISLHGDTALLALMVAPEDASWSSSNGTTWCAWRIRPGIQVCAYAAHAELSEV